MWVKPTSKGHSENMGSNLGYHLVLGPLFWKCPIGPPSLWGFTLHIFFPSLKKVTQSIYTTKQSKYSTLSCPLWKEEGAWWCESPLVPYFHMGPIISSHELALFGRKGGATLFMVESPRTFPNSIWTFACMRKWYGINNQAIFTSSFLQMIEVIAKFDPFKYP